MKKISIKKVIAASTISLILVQMFYLVIEPTVALATAVTSNVVVTLNVTSGVSISNTTSNVATMTPNISVGQHKSIGKSSWTVATNSATGYTLALKATGPLPALKNGAVDSFADYSPATLNTPELWSVASGTKEFGYSVYSVLPSTNTPVSDVPSATWGTNTTTTCGNAGTGVTDGTLKYRDFTTTDVQVGSRATVTPFTGIETIVCFGAEESAVYAAAGTYTATITATATAV